MAAKRLFDGGASGTLYLDQRDFYLDPTQVHEYYKSLYPFLKFLDMTPSQKTNDGKYKMFEFMNPAVKQEFQITATDLIPNSDSGTTITIKDDTTKGLAGESANVATDAYTNLTFEVYDSTRTTYKGSVLITAVPSDTTITVKSQKAATVQLANDDYFLYPSNARGEATTAPDSWAKPLDVVYNNTQYFSTAVEISKHLAEANLRGYSKDIARLRLNKAGEFALQKVRGYLYGTSVAGTGMSGTAFADTYRTDADGNAVRSTYGLMSAIRDYGATSGDYQNNWTIQANDYSYAEFVEMCEKIAQFNNYGGQALALAGRGAVTWLATLIESSNWDGVTYHRNVERKNLGVKVSRIETPHIDIDIMVTDALKDAPRKNQMCIFDHGNVGLVKYFDEEFKNNIKTEDDYSGVKDLFTGDSGIYMTNLYSHHLLTVNRG